MDLLLRKLENESLLLMYLAGELSTEDHQEIDTMLLADPALRAQLESLKQMLEASTQTLTQLDAMNPLPPVERSVRPIAKAMAQWQVDRFKHAAAAPVRSMKIPIWAISTVSAAVLLVCVCSWWGMNSDMEISRQMPVTDPSQVSIAPPDVPANMVTPPGSTTTPDEQVKLVMNENPSERLTDLEQSVHEDLR